MANLHLDWVSTRALAVIAGTVGVVHYLLVRFRFKEIGKYLAEREGSTSSHNKRVMHEISENTPENTSQKLMLRFFGNGMGICGCASPKLYLIEESRRSKSTTDRRQVC